MTRREKLLLRFLSRPVDYTWDEMVTLMRRFGFEYISDGGGSHGAFYNEERDLFIKSAVKPHGGKSVVKDYQMKKFKEKLITYGFIEPEDD